MSKPRLSILALSLALGPGLSAQRPRPQAPRPAPIHESDDPALRGFRWRSIGPASMAGRIDDFAVVGHDAATFYVGFATGGIWKTTNGGTTFTPVFDTYGTGSIGDLAVSQNDPRIVWAGTGEPNNRQSSSYGDGIYKSTDAGKTWKHAGLRDTQTIGRIVIDPKNDNTVYVAAVGHLFGPNEERGLYKTVDGGRSWQKVLYVDADTGVTDVVIDPRNPRVLYAATYQRRRTPWGMNGGGPGSGIWKTTDAGETWKRLIGDGLPKGTLGRIALDIYRADPRILVAQIEVAPTTTARPQRRGPRQGGQRQAGQRQAPPDPKRSGLWRTEDSGATWKLLSNNNSRPMYFSQVRIDPSDSQIVYTAGQTFSKSTDGGRTFRGLRGYSHVDHHAAWVNPYDSRHLLLGNDGGINQSFDGGATWDYIDSLAVGQFYAVAADMSRPYNVHGGLQDNGSWGGPSRTRSRNGILNADWFRVGGGDGFYCAVDPTDPNIIYSESQNGNVRRTDLSTGTTKRIRPRAKGSITRFGRTFKFEGNIVPPPKKNTRYRFHWNTPLQISPHNPRTIHVGGNCFFTSVDRGDTWTASKDLTRAKDRNKLEIMGVRGDKPMAARNDGTSSWGTITTLAESPARAGICWVGTDDGTVQVSQDGGRTWTDVSTKIPELTWKHTVSRVEPSRFDAATCYVTVDGHLHDDMKPYVWVTRDFGKTWKSLANGLPHGNVNVIEEDTKNEDLLFLGTEHGVYASLDGGATWKRFMTGLPTVRVDDLLVHPRDGDLIVATHGRSVWIADDITPLQQMKADFAKKGPTLFAARPAVQWKTDIRLSRASAGGRRFVGRNPEAGALISYWLDKAANAAPTITIKDIGGKVVRTLKGGKSAGLNRVRWDLRHAPPKRTTNGNQRQRRGRFGRRRRSGPAAAPGDYAVELKAGGKTLTGSIRVLEDVWLGK